MALLQTRIQHYGELVHAARGEIATDVRTIAQVARQVAARRATLLTAHLLGAQRVH